MQDIILLAGWVFDQCTAVFDLYTSTFVLSGVLALWLIRKVVNVIRHL